MVKVISGLMVNGKKTKMTNICRSGALCSFVKEIKAKYKQKGLKPPTTDRIVRFLLKKSNISSEDVLRNEIIRF